MPERNRNASGARPDYEVAWYTKELGRALQREMLQKQLARFSDSAHRGASHGEDAGPQLETAPPEEDRAG